MILFLFVVLVVLGVVFGIVWAGRLLRRHTTRRWPIAVASGLFFGTAIAMLVVPLRMSSEGSNGFSRIAVPIVILSFIAALICFSALIENGPKPSAADGWAAAHGLAINPGNSDFIVAYVFEGHRLRLICGIGGFFAAAALSAGTGLDLKASGWVWLLTGYLVGVVWSEAWLTRLPAGTQRMASLTPRRVSDYLATGMQRAQVVVGAASVALAGLALAQGSDVRLSSSFGSDFGDASARSMQHTAVGMAVAAVVLLAGVGLLQRHIVGKPQPMADPDLLAADDAVRASAVHLLSGTSIAIVLLLIGTQFRLLASIGAVVDGVAFFGAALSFLGALVAWRYYGHRAWVVRRPKSSNPRTSTLEGSWS